jgi:hypothetical protein
VNQDIEQSLSDKSAPDFWWLNNGVTILATSAIPLGKTSSGNALQLHDVQIVNGLQTTQTIYNYFSSAKEIPEGCILVQVIVSDNSDIRDRIIRATNNQSSVELASLSATDKVQRDIEAILEQYGWYYERRRNYYKNIGKPTEKFVEPLYLATGLVALVRKSPSRSGRLKSRFMLDAVSYAAVFSESIPILLWPKLASIMKIIDSALIGKTPKHKSGRRVLAGWRGAVALCAVAELLRKFDYSIQDLIDLDASKLLRNRIREIFDILTIGLPIDELYELRTSGGPNQIARIDLHVMKFGKFISIEDTQVVGKWVMPITPLQARQPVSIRVRSQVEPHPPKQIISTEVLNKVREVIPTQPWSPGMQHVVAEQTGIDQRTVGRVIKQLIKSGIFNNQIDGVVIATDGRITAIDKARAAAHYQVGDQFYVRDPIG